MVCCVFRSSWSRVFPSLFFFFKQKTAYEMRISDWSSDVCSSDLSITSPRLCVASTNIPPHNLGEVIDATLATIDNPAITLDELMAIVQIGRASCRESVCQYV